MAKERENLRKLNEDHRKELENLQGCLELYHTKSKEEIEIYKEALKNFKQELNIGLEALRRGLISPDQLIAIVEEMGLDFEAQENGQNKGKKNKKKSVEMSISADWMHQPRLILNSPDRISRLVASVSKGGGIPISFPSSEPNLNISKENSYAKPVKYRNDQEKENVFDIEAEDAEKLAQLVSEITEVKKDKDKEGKTKSKFSFLRGKKDKKEYSPRPSKSGECLTFVLKENGASVNSNGSLSTQAGQELTSPAKLSTTTNNLETNKSSEKKDSRLCSHALKSF